MPTRPRLFPPKLQREYDWAFAHYDELACQYPNQWVAFANGRVLAGGPNVMRVLAEARRQLDWDHIPHLFFEFGVHVYGSYYR